MEFYDIERCPITHGDCIQDNCRFFRRPEKLPASCRARKVILDNKELFSFLGELTKYNWLDIDEL